MDGEGTGYARGVLSEHVKDKLEEAVIAWADEYLLGKPRILATAVYFALEKALIEQQDKIEGAR